MAELMQNPRISVCVPIYGRPQRTLRLVDQLRRQTINNYQLYLIGDNCPVWQQILDEGIMQDIIKEEEQKGNEWIAINLDEHYGGYGYAIRNMMKELADADFICFIDNDDCILPNHLEHYLSEIENTDLDFVFYNTWNNALNLLRDSQASMGLIGHSELCLRTSFYKITPNQGTNYGHDWEMISWMINHTSKYKKANSRDWTYKVMGTPVKRETDID